MAAKGEPVRISAIHIENYLGIKAFDAEVGAGGLVVQGRNGSGKTTVLKAVKAALEGEGVAPTAIHLGATKGEIRVDLGDLSVKRVLTEKGSTVKITTREGAVMPAPQTYLQRLLGVSSLDPLAFWQERDPKRRRAMLLEAVQVQVTPAMLKVWCGAALAELDLAGLLGVERKLLTPAHEDDPLPGHGLDLVGRVHAAAYARRTEENRRAKDAGTEHGREADAVKALLAELGDGPVLGLDEAMRALDAVRGEEAVLEGRRRAALDAVKGRARVTAQIERLHEQAVAKRADAPVAPAAEDFERARAAVDAARVAANEKAARVAELEQLLATANQEEAAANLAHQQAGDAWQALKDREARAAQAQTEAAGLEAQATDLSSALGTLPAEPTQDEIAALADRRVGAERDRERAAQGEAIRKQEVRAAEAKARLDAVKARAGALDTACSALSKDATRELLAGAAGLEGVTIEGDTIKLGGVSLDDLSGRERMLFAVRLSKALGRSKILLVDGLEAVGPEDLPAFVAEATADGYQLIAARVDVGPARVEQIAAGEGA